MPPQSESIRVECNFFYRLTSEPPVSVIAVARSRCAQAALHGLPLLRALRPVVPADDPLRLDLHGHARRRSRSRSVRATRVDGAGGGVHVDGVKVDEDCGRHREKLRVDGVGTYKVASMASKRHASRTHTHKQDDGASGTSSSCCSSARRRSSAGVGIGGGNARFLGHNLSCFLVYIWARTYEGQEVAVMEFFTIRAEPVEIRRPKSSRRRPDAVMGTSTLSRRRSDGVHFTQARSCCRGSSRRRRPARARAAGPRPGTRASPSATRTRSCGSGSASRRRARCAPSTRRGRSCGPSTRRFRRGLV